MLARLWYDPQSLDFLARIQRGEILYAPDAKRRQGCRIWLGMCKNLFNSRELIWRLIVRDIQVPYRQSLLGYAWAVLLAAATVAIFSFLKASETVPLRDTPIPYVAYALWGISLWELFASGLTSATGSLVAAGSLVSSILFSKDSLVIASLGAPIFDFLVRLLPLAVVFVWMRVPFK